MNKSISVRMLEGKRSRMDNFSTRKGNSSNMTDIRAGVGHYQGP